MEEITYKVLEGNKLKITGLRNSNITYRNFAGEKTQFNTNGTRKFTIRFYDAEAAQKLKDLGWNIKIKMPKNEDGDPFYTLEVKVRLDLDWVKPKIVQFTHDRRIQITEDNIANFDRVEFDRVDVVLRQYPWKNMTGASGISAQLSEMYARTAEPILEADWASEEAPDDDDVPFDM